MIQQYIDSGILEAYVTGSASEEEVKELMYMKVKHPEVNTALEQLENDMEKFARHMAIAPPETLRNKIFEHIDELIVRPVNDPEEYKAKEEKGYKNVDNGPHYIEVEAESNHIKVNKTWKWVFIAVFILAKIFLACAIYFYLENRQAQQQIIELKTELRQLNR
jgi:hypothetical protein